MAETDLCTPPLGKRPRTLLSDHPLFSASLSDSPERQVDVIDSPSADSEECPGLPKGVKLKFHPSDEELILHLLAKVGKGEAGPHPLINEFIVSLDDDDDDQFGYTHPQRLPGVKQDGSFAYFFHRRTKVFNPRNREHQKMQIAEFGVFWWHKIGKNLPVTVDGVHRGCKKIFALYATMKEGSNPEKTDWVMDQYHLGTEEAGEGEFVVSKIYYQQKSTQSDKEAPDLISVEDKASSGCGCSNVDSVIDYSSEFRKDEGKDSIDTEFSTNEIFKSREELIRWVRDRGRLNGFVVIVNKSELGSKGRKPRLVFSCERGGKFRNHHRGGAKNKVEPQRTSSVSKKCECPFSLTGKKLAVGDDWMLVVDCGEHNHPITEQVKHSFAGRLTEEENALLADMFDRAVQPKDILAALKQRYPSNLATIRTVYNAFQKYKLTRRVTGPQHQQLAYECISSSTIHEALTDMSYESKTLWSFAL